MGASRRGRRLILRKLVLIERQMRQEEEEARAAQLALGRAEVGEEERGFSGAFWNWKNHAVPIKLTGITP